MLKNPLLSLSMAIIVVCSALVFFATEASYDAIGNASVWVRNYFGTFYLYLGLGCVLLLFGVAFSPLGKLKLGKKDQKPQYSLWAWTAMLYSAGMGAGILLRAVQEPVFMQRHPPYPSSLEPEILALEYTFYQWGFTAWAFYGLFAMVVGYSLFVRKKKVLVSATVENTITNNMAKKGIDITTIITTVFGLIAAVGLGVTQINGGLNYVFGGGFGLGTALSLAVLVSAIAFYSAWQEVDKGIKIISQTNILVTFLLLLFIFFSSDMGAILSSFGKATWHYLIDFIPMSLAYGSYNPGTDFLTDWTFYYWAFWLAWAPFTGIFIARISQGRTLRQMLLGVLILPSLGTFFWFSVFGTSAFQLMESWGAYNEEFGNVFSSLFVFFGHYPLATLLNLVTIFLLIGFLVTSLDSAVFVLSMFTDKGKKEPGKKHRLIWSGFILLATMALLLLGNAKPDIDVLTAVQKLLIITSLPFAFFMIFMGILFISEVARTQKNSGP